MSERECERCGDTLELWEEDFCNDCKDILNREWEKEVNRQISDYKRSVL